MPYLSALEVFHDEALYKYTFTFTFTYWRLGLSNYFVAFTCGIFAPRTNTNATATNNNIVNSIHNLLFFAMVPRLSNSQNKGHTKYTGFTVMMMESPVGTTYELQPSSIDCVSSCGM